MDNLLCLILHKYRRRTWIMAHGKIYPEMVCVRCGKIKENEAENRDQK